MTPEECQIETLKHIFKVRSKIEFFCRDLIDRMLDHDDSKLQDPELEHFTRLTPKLKHSTYMSDEYKGFLELLKPALDHHYKNNRHHPEHFPEGVNNMTLVDIIEMLCDWAAACGRHADGNLYQSILKNQLRFGLSAQLTQILINTAADMEGMSVIDYAKKHSVK
ncbi:MAG: hypothetical protein HGJ94_17235 [Desulfosarcina sp.]|nr:hypothetical protein [Desulfosarcina sp.]MBC2742115.1 hypothetical protein [Desulfosarcina sp.]MBC2765028.1 hypothetical protein [Desulfosarcina sp.]